MLQSPTLNLKGKKMEVKITYCNSWNYRPVASRVEEQILANIPGATVSKIIGNGGNFIVEANGKVFFSKKDLIGTDVNALPSPDEVAILVEKIKQSA